MYNVLSRFASVRNISLYNGGRKQLGGSKPFNFKI